MIGPRSTWRRIERALAGELSAGARRKLWVQLRGDPRARARYDAAVEALRVLEGDAALASFEVDLVERWVVEDLPAAAPAASAARWARWSVMFALATAILLALVLRRPGPPRPEDGMGVRGMDAPGRLAIEALCGPGRGDGSDLHPLSCDPDDVLGFAYRVDAQATGRVLTLFGVDARGDAMFYAPTPVDEAAISVVPGRWQAVETGVKLSVNHAEGPLDVYAVLAPEAATVEQVRGWAARLAATAEPADAASWSRSWPRRIGAPDLQGLCRSADACDVAQLRLWIGRQPP